MAFSMIVLSALPGQDAYIKGYEAENAGHFKQAIEAYKDCAAKDPRLEPFAYIRVAQCRSELDNLPSAIAGLRTVLKDYPRGAWTSMAKAYLAKALVKEKKHKEAARLFKESLDVSTPPWWMNAYAWAAAENLLEDPGTQAEGFDFFFNQVETTNFLNLRYDAAKVLIDSPEPRHCRSAIFGMIRARKFKDAGAALLQSAGTMLCANDLGNTQELINSWGSMWLAYSIYQQANNKETEGALLSCQRLVERYPESRDAGDALWWLARYFHGRDDEKNTRKLYEQLVEKCPDHYRVDDALFEMGWQDYEKKDYEASEKLFNQLIASFPTSRFGPQAQYFSAIMLLNQGKKDVAIEKLKKTTQAGLGNFYAHRALDRLQEMDSATKAPRGNLRIDGREPILQPFSGRRVKDKAYRLSADEMERLAFFGAFGLEAGEWESMALCQELQKSNAGVHDYEPIAVAGYVHTALQYAPKGDRAAMDFPRAYWPQVTALARELQLDPFLMLALAKQESTYRASIQSHAGATGVMQLMPRTANWMAEVEKNISPRHAANLKSADNSLRLGGYYLKRMMKRYDNNMICALAAYNGGPGNTDKWLKRFKGYSTEEFIEAIPFDETRGYVKKVLGNYAAFHSLYEPFDYTK
jgi:soluble lytic murein transglycosylase-like protein